MSRLLKIRHDVDPEDIYVRLTCSVTGKVFRKSLDGGHTLCTCRCARETFDIYAEPLEGYIKIDVEVTDRWNRTTEVKNFDVFLDEGDKDEFANR